MAARRGLRLDRTLGPVVLQWIEDNLCHGPGDVQGQRIEHDDEEALFIMRAYELDDKGRRLVRRAVLSRPKGRRKSEIAAELICVEALGPARFGGWDSQGRPTGMPVTSPIIKCAATEETQADNAYSGVEFMLKEGKIASTPGLSVGMTRTLLPGGGKITPITAKASSKDGGRETFCCFDETHMFNNLELRKLHATIRRNLAKRKIADPWCLETSTMYAPGEDSVAEASHRYWEAIQSGSINDASFLFDHRQGPARFDFDDDDQLRAALIEAYGIAAEWIDIERMILEARDPQTDQGDFMRYFINVPTERMAGKWITDEKWRSCQAKTEIEADGSVVVAVDAAHSRDTSACVWSWRDPDTNRIVQRSRVWSCVEGSPHDVFVPGGRLDNDLVRDFILNELSTWFSVELVIGDPMYFDDQMKEIGETGVTTVEMIQGSTDMREAWDEFYGHVHAGRTPTLMAPPLEVPGGETYAKHVRNAIGVKTERGWKVSKKTAITPIDCVAAGAMSAWGLERIDDLTYVGGGLVFSD